TKLAAADHANVTFEVDQIDERTRSGWSVLVRGLAEEVTSEHRTELIERTKATGVEPWAPGDRGHWMLARWGLCTEAVDDADAVSAAVQWAMREPALLECDGQDSYRSVYGVVLAAGSRLWRQCYRAAVASDVLTPLERVIQGD